MNSGSFPIVSRWLIANAVIPFNLTAYFKATKSIQPHLLGLFVVTPYSWPSSLIVSPISLFCSVTNGPLPTREEYALETP